MCRQHARCLIISIEQTQSITAQTTTASPEKSIWMLSSQTHTNVVSSKIKLGLCENTFVITVISTHALSIVALFIFFYNTY
ncbi:hypothetical protein [Staphylococcus edaphicus]|uniref:hypothetical protein n=1 Tax=Staphylococcus edaphicus TaxID=1955013 RepID=UPI0012900E45|nr:hypothetical protein [Staphylococcus edaphicus]